MKNSIKKNFLYNSIMMFFNIGFPIITAPYVSRILGVEKIGEINFGSSFVGWFILIASLGLPTYATREIARNRQNKEKLKEIFNEILVLHFISVLVLGIIYFVVIIYVPRLQIYNKILTIYSLNLMFSFFSLDWFYYGMEDYEYISKRSLFFKIISLILILTFVKEEKDFYKYVYIIIFGMGANNILNIMNSTRYVDLSLKINLKILYKHVISAKIFYFQVILGSMYSVVIQIILGIKSSTIELGYYSRSNQLIMLIITVILSFARTISPRLSSYYSENNLEYRKLLIISFRMTSFFIFPCLIGSIFLSETMMYIFGGEQFISGSMSLKILSFLIISTVYSTFLDTNISLPSGNERNTLYGNIGVAAITLILTLLLSGRFGANGVAFSIVIGESVGLIIQIIRIKSQKLYLGFFDKNLIKYILASLLMGLILIFFISKIKLGYIDKIIIIPLGIFLYLLFIFIISKLMKLDNEIEIILKKVLKREN